MHKCIRGCVHRKTAFWHNINMFATCCVKWDVYTKKYFNIPKVRNKSKVFLTEVNEKDIEE